MPRTKIRICIGTNFFLLLFYYHRGMFEYRQIAALRFKS